MKETNQNTVTSLVKNISILKLDKKSRLNNVSGGKEIVPGKQIHFCNRNYFSAPGRILPGLLFQMISLGTNRSVFPMGNPSVWDSMGVFHSTVMFTEAP